MVNQMYGICFIKLIIFKIYKKKAPRSQIHEKGADNDYSFTVEEGGKNIDFDYFAHIDNILIIIT